MGNLIYVVEDEVNIRELIDASLRVGGFEIQGFEKSKELFNNLKIKKPQLIMLDIMLPEESGLDILKRIRSMFEYKDIPVIFLTAKSSELDKVAGLDLGADDFIVKPFGVLELNARVKAVMRRYNKSGIEKKDIDVFSYKDITINTGEKTAYKQDKKISLTFKEYELLLYLYKNKGIVLSREQILTNVWEQEYGKETRTVDVHIKSLRDKMGDTNENTYILTLRGHGYMLVKE